MIDILFILLFWYFFYDDYLKEVEDRQRVPKRPVIALIQQMLHLVPVLVSACRELPLKKTAISVAVTESSRVVLKRWRPPTSEIESERKVKTRAWTQLLGEPQVSFPSPFHSPPLSVTMPVLCDEARKVMPTALPTTTNISFLLHLLVIENRTSRSPRREIRIDRELPYSNRLLECKNPHCLKRMRF